MRDEGKDWTGNSTYLWTIAGAAYMALLGPEGFVELGRAIVGNAHRAARRIGSLNGVTIARPTGFFQEFLVDFSATGMSVAEINKALLRHGIFGGIDLSGQEPSLGQTALYCVTEIHGEADIDRLVSALETVLAA